MQELPVSKYPATEMLASGRNVDIPSYFFDRNKAMTETQQFPEQLNRL
jgi:hypothetical protein